MQYIIVYPYPSHSQYISKIGDVSIAFCGADGNDGPGSAATGGCGLVDYAWRGDLILPEPSFDTLKSAQKQKTLISQKKCYTPLKSAHLVVSFCRAPPHVQTAGSPRILATYTDTITLCLGSRCLGSPQPTSFAAAASKSSNSLGWAELDT